MDKISKETIQAWKNKYRHVYEVEIKDNGETVTGYFRRPEMDSLAAVSKLSKTDEVRAANILFDSCWLGGDAIIKEDAVLKMAAITQFERINKVQSVTLKNL